MDQISPRSKQQNEQIRAERRKAILDAAVQLFAESGFSHAGISDVARAAGVSHGTVFLYFASKEELFQAAVLEPLSEAERWILTFARDTGTPLERIRRMVRAHVPAFVREERYLRLVQYVLGQRERFPELAGAMFAFARRFQEALMPIIRAGQLAGELAPGDPQATAWAYFSFLNGLALNTFDQPDSLFWDELIKNGIRIFGPLQPDEEESDHGRSLPD